VAKAESLGARVLVQAANGDDALQNSQAENLLTQGIDVLVVVPHNSKTTATIVESAHRLGVPVLAYDRLIEDCDLDLYVSFDAVRVGELQAEYAVARKPRGNYVLIFGAPTDNNAHLFRRGNMNVLQPLIDRGDITVVAEQWARDWLAVEALKIMENALTASGNRVDAVVAANDGTASGAIQALAEQRLTGRVIVTGQDAELEACRRIVAGTQTMTIYKPLRALAERAAEAAVKLARREPLPEASKTVPNGRKDVPAILVETIAVDRDNLASTVVAEGFHRVEDVWRDAPRDQWPSAGTAP
jgi:D-xylose transport system substrate-binding protein